MSRPTTRRRQAGWKKPTPAKAHPSPERAYAPRRPVPAPVERVLRKAVVIEPRLRAYGSPEAIAEIETLFAGFDVIYGHSPSNGRGYLRIVMLWRPREHEDQRWVESELKTRLLPGGELVWLV